MAINVENLFEIPSNVTYLNCASLSPQLKSVTAAGLKGLQKKIYPWEIQTADWFDDAETLRTLAAKVINADAEGMAIVPSVSYGISIAAKNLPVQKGQYIVVMDQEYPSNYYSWAELAKSTGAEIRTVKKKDQTWTESVLAAIDHQTAIVSISHCHWTNGALVDLLQISQKTKSVGTALVIDASQAMGAHPIDIDAIQPDFLVAVGYKWLLGPYGLSYLYAAPKWRTEGQPIEYSWLTKKDSEDFAGLVNYRDDFRPGARRFDMGAFPGFIHIPMAIAALQQVLDWGVVNIQMHLRALTHQLAERADQLGLKFPAGNERVDHIVGLELPNGIPLELKAELNKQSVFVGYRGNSIRVAPYLHTKAADIEKFMAIVARFV